MIVESELNAVVEYLSEHGLSEAVVSDLRKKYSNHHFTYCTEDDINTGSPVLEKESYSIYLVNSTDHCSVLTNDMETASGYVIAENIEE